MTEKQSLFRKAFEALIEARSREAKRQVARYLGRRRTEETKR